MSALSNARTILATLLDARAWRPGSFGALSGAVVHRNRNALTGTSEQEHLCRGGGVARPRAGRAAGRRCFRSLRHRKRMDVLDIPRRPDTSFPPSWRSSWRRDYPVTASARAAALSFCCRSSCPAAPFRDSRSRKIATSRRSLTPRRFSTDSRRGIARREMRRRFAPLAAPPTGWSRSRTRTARGESTWNGILRGKRTRTWPTPAAGLGNSAPT